MISQEISKLKTGVWRMLGKGATFLVILSLVISPILIPPKKTEAELPVIDPALVAIASVVSSVLGVIDTATSALVAKEYVLDGIFYTIAKFAVSQIVQSTVNWINGGFNDNPKFLENPGQFFKEVADETLGHYLEGSEFGFICSPFQVQIGLALIEKHYGRGTPRCTLSGALNNLEDFADFVSIDYGVSQRNVPGRVFKWSEWHGVVKPEGNPYGAYAAAEAELSFRLSTNKGNIQKELDLGRGLLSFKDCSDVDAEVDKRSYVNVSPEEEGELRSQAKKFARGTGKSNCKTKTPGSVIETQLNKVLGAPLEGLIEADEINEIITALLGQLVQQVLGDNGLSSTNKSNQNFGERSYYDSLQSESISTLNTNRQTLSARANESLATLNEYLQAKNQSVLRTNISIDFQNQIITRCGTSSTQSTAEGNILNTLNPIKTKLQNEIATAEDYKTQLDEIQTELNTLPQSDTGGFTRLFNEYNELLKLISVNAAASQAINERDVTLPEQLNPIDSSAQATISSCNIIR